MKRLATTVFVLSAWLSCALLGGCANRPPPAPPLQLLHDDWFPAASQPIEPGAIFALTPAMQRYADTELAQPPRSSDRRMALTDALFKRSQLRLEYDSATTRTAGEAFEARAGNCLSLVLMTAAFAKHLALPVNYRHVQVDEMYTRSGSLLLASGHVNLVLGPARPNPAFSAPWADDLVIDFLPASEIRSQRWQPLAERTIVAMFFNNRAAEALADGHTADAYAWARAAALQDPAFTAAANTLAVVYLRGGHLQAAEDALRHVLAQEPDSISALSNLVTVLTRTGRGTESQAVAARLAALQPSAPFHFYDQGRVAMANGDHRTALALFERELQRQPYQPEVHFWAAQAYWQLGDRQHAARHLALAVDNSGNTRLHDLYAGKLSQLRALPVQ